MLLSLPDPRRERLPIGPAHPGRTRHGFTLVELLVVLAIMAIIMASTLPVLNSVMSTYNLNSAAQAVIAQLTFARQTALTSNDVVEVRFYQVTDAIYTSTNTYRAIQCFQETNSGTTALTKPYFCPAGIIFSSNITYSSLLNTSSNSYGIISTPSGDSTHPLPPPYNISPYLYFTYQPTGQTDLTLPGTSTTSPCITLYSETSPHGTTGLPNNYITITLDVINGTARTYQP